MPILPDEYLQVLLPYAHLFCKRVFAHAQLLVAGAILAPGKRTVTSVLRIMGLSADKSFHKYHRVLSQARWSALAGSRLLLSQLLAENGQGPVVVGIDETLERRWGPRIQARGIYGTGRPAGCRPQQRQPLRQVQRPALDECHVAARRPLTNIHWANRVWALPFLTALAPSERYYADPPRLHKSLTDWARQWLLQVKHWAGQRKVIAVGDSNYAVIDLLKALQGRVSLISRLRVDAALDEPAPPRRAGQRGRQRLKGKRLPTLATLAAAPSTLWQKLTVAGLSGRVASARNSST